MSLVGTDFDGATCAAEAVSVEEYVRIRKGFATPEPGEVGDENLLNAFAEHLVSWNLEHDGVPIPLTPSSEAIRSVDSSLAISMAVGWLNKITEVQRPRPLGLSQTLAEQSEPAQGNGAVVQEVL